MPKRKEIDFTEEDAVCASETVNQDGRIRSAEMILQNMDDLYEALKNEVGVSVENSEALLKAFLEDTKELCETSAFNKSFKVMVDDIVSVDDDSSDDEAPAESITDPWEIMFQQLREYKIENGSSAVPQKYKQNPKLGQWVKSQRGHYKKRKLKMEKIVKLDGLGMWWGKDFPKPAPWNDMFEKLKSYRQHRGDCNVPFNADNPTALARWAANQRMEYKRFKKGRDSLLDLEQIQNLNEIEMNWRGPKL